AAQDAVGSPYELWDDRIYFLRTLIKAPPGSAADFFSRYQQHDFMIQAVVKGNKIFPDFACGSPGSMRNV
ncbi:unnamed protein product, partial [Pocillopora meandrina]